MSILTGRELEFLASLRTSWSRLYCSELARLLKHGDCPGDVLNETPSIALRLAGEKYRPRLVFSCDEPAKSTIGG
jgi:hypothetical protein